MAKDLQDIASQINLKGGKISSKDYRFSRSTDYTHYTPCDCGDCTNDNCDCHDGDCSDCVCTDCNNCDD